jgi:integrase
MEKAVWTVPAERMKAGREHRVPLSKPALAILRAQHKATGGQGIVFPGRLRDKPLGEGTMLTLLKSVSPATVHGMRSSLRDWSEERTNFPGSVAEAALGHIVGDKVEAAYRRGDLFDKRRQLMDAWARHCTTPEESGKVVSIKRG